MMNGIADGQIIGFFIAQFITLQPNNKAKTQEQPSSSKHKPTNDREKTKSKRVKEDSKKETILSKKHIERNPKPNHN